MPDLFDRFRVIDADSHVSEPADLWTSRVASKWKDKVPYIERDKRSGKDVWWIGGQPTLPVGMTAIPHTSATTANVFGLTRARRPTIPANPSNE